MNGISLTKITVSAISGKDYSKRDDAVTILAKLAVANPSVVMETVGTALLDPDSSWHWRIGSNRDIFSAMPVDTVMAWLSNSGLEGARRLARHLPSPSVSPEGEGTVPELTERVLAAYGGDETVLNEFRVGRHDMEATWGPPSANYEARAQSARVFLNHPLEAIRQWAEHEMASSQHFADIFRRSEEDEGFGD